MLLDVGCGDGSLMDLLYKKKYIEVRGLELNQINVQECIHKGLPVIQGNAETELHQFPDQSFDFVVLSQTLQAFYNPIPCILTSLCSHVHQIFTLLVHTQLASLFFRDHDDHRGKSPFQLPRGLPGLSTERRHREYRAKGLTHLMSLFRIPPAQEDPSQLSRGGPRLDPC